MNPTGRFFKSLVNFLIVKNKLRVGGAIYFGLNLKYKYCENLNKIGSCSSFCAGLGSTQCQQQHRYCTYRHTFVTHFLRPGVFNTGISVENSTLISYAPYNISLYIVYCM